MKVELMGVIITIAGLIFFTVSLAIIILGKKVGDKGQQKISISKYVEVNTNSVLTLVLITACIALAPIALTYWKPDLSNYVDKNEVAKSYLALKDLSITIYGIVIYDDGRWANDVKVELIRNYENSADTITERTGQQGNYTIEIQQAKPKEKYTIIWYKDGYAQQKLNFGFNQIPYPLKLTKEGGN